MFSGRAKLPALPALRTPLHEVLRYSVTLWRNATHLFTFLGAADTITRPPMSKNKVKSFWAWICDIVQAMASSVFCQVISFLDMVPFP